ncbi:ribosomal RNA small subunit methyltransferase RsmB [Synechococcus sp. PCC 7502]|uniref:16S rRNA (cytosine(967)-C(5))-methyltransferase n=1 Tax=Synechococcus sp. PCC 7502 TaxID=1173263 RepID=UPI00029FF0C3|nr:16S rRNA (cytosine(967)-C(5))-methyltransferase [Synechococcus sp. PCC 7502]AFY73497.1 ribosomal RNA small subunit methyltransferase RsmB [Synechococcus sp. PCC 7502]
MTNARKLAFDALKSINKQKAFADIALDRLLQSYPDISKSDRSLVTELVYGITRRQRTLDALIAEFTGKPTAKQPPDLRLILHIGIYQIVFLDQIPNSAAVNTTVDLAKSVKLGGLSGLVNAVLRKICREQEQHTLFNNIHDLGTLHSFPDWLIELWIEQFGREETDQLCQWFNQSPHIDLRTNILKITTAELITLFEATEIKVQSLPLIPNALRLNTGSGNIPSLVGFTEGLWTVQDASAQLTGLILDPQPNETIIDACAAPGGKTTHIAELMGNQGLIYACDRTASRLQKLQQNCDRLGLSIVQIRVGDSREFADFQNQADRVLLDVPCSGLGTLHRHADARWRQNPEESKKLAILQTELLNQAATWVKNGGILVYSTCTIHPDENEAVIKQFLATHPHWKLVTPNIAPQLQSDSSHPWLKILPHKSNMDGFFIAKLQKF